MRKIDFAKDMQEIIDNIDAAVERGTSNTSFEHKRAAILNSDETHYWVKNLLKELDFKDPCDVLHNLEMLVDLYSGYLSQFRGKS